MTSGPKPIFAVAGDSQAEAVSLVLRRLDAIAAAYDVLYVDARAASALPKGDAARCAFWVVQTGGELALKPPSKKSKSIVFPALRFRLLWPLAAPLPKAVADGATAEFAWGDAFIGACVARDLPADEIMRLYKATAWNESWPDLDRLFKDETGALLAADAKSDVKIGSFVLKHFRMQRLFWGVNAPSNALFAELTYRILHACFAREVPADRNAVHAALASIGTQELMARAALPIHPLVAAHFDLKWYDPLQRYLNPAGGMRTFDEYYRGLIDYLYACA